MMTREYPDDALLQMESMLDHGRKRVVWASVVASIRRGLGLMGAGVLVIGALFFFLRLFSSWFGTAGVCVSTGLLLIGVWVVGVLGWSFLRGRREAKAADGQVAERLDLSQETHNRIATAIEFLKSEDDSAFGRAAIVDGWETLEKVKEEEPEVERIDVGWVGVLSKGLGGVLLLLLGLFFVPKSEGDLLIGDVEVGELKEMISDDSKGLNKGDPDQEKPEDDDGDLEEEEPGGKPSKSGKEGVLSEERESDQESKGKMSKSTETDAKQSQSASKSNSGASGGGAKSKPGDEEPKKSKLKKKKDWRKYTKKPKKPKKPEDPKEGGSISARGASGSSSSQTPQNEWTSKVKAKADDEKESPQDEELDDGGEQEKMRVGAQPALKNRSSKISRDLSLMTGTDKLMNKQNRGRGGPGGGKKTRGTATMIMGVPVPGFVKGKLLPGPTKTTQEESKPKVKKGDFVESLELPTGRPEEDAQKRYLPTGSLAAQAKRYLIEYHSQNENQRTEDRGEE